MTNEQAVELCKRAKSVCLMSIQDTRSAVMHWTSNNQDVSNAVDALERLVKEKLDQEARVVFAQNELAGKVLI